MISDTMKDVLHRTDTRRGGIPYFRAYPALCHLQGISARGARWHRVVGGGTLPEFVGYPKPIVALIPITMSLIAENAENVLGVSLIIQGISATILSCFISVISLNDGNGFKDRSQLKWLFKSPPRRNQYDFHTIVMSKVFILTCPYPTLLFQQRI